MSTLRRLSVSYLASALVPPIGNLVHQLVREDVTDAQLASIFEQGCERVLHVQGGLLFVLAHLQLEVRLPNVSCDGGAERSSACLSKQNIRYCTCTLD